MLAATSTQFMVGPEILSRYWQQRPRLLSGLEPHSGAGVFEGAREYPTGFPSKGD